MTITSYQVSLVDQGCLLYQGSLVDLVGQCCPVAPAHQVVLEGLLHHSCQEYHPGLVNLEDLNFNKRH